MTSRTTPQGPGYRTGVILAALAEQTTVTAQDLSRRTGIPISAVYRHLHDLVQLGLAASTRTRGRYCAGSLSVQMAENYRREMLSGGEVKRRLTQLTADTQELAAFLIPSGHHVLCVEAAEGARVIKCSFSPGLTKPLTFGASAQAILAHLPAERIAEVSEAHQLTAERVAALHLELRRVRDRGYAVSTGAVDEGVWGVSVPVFDRLGQVNGTVSTMAPEFRVRRSHQALLTLTHAAAQDISRFDELS
ncbi:IclR family transcriptional regulator [Streptomyces sp. NBC_01012]|uniref:IclR family transcriptional regulator n=1 Tax=Streptomyces sp. NBC_01012 TaxID=2903717 RepID=UPI00386F193A|nr:IclR family transcriptional regulator [Streptomyces sp. NBC_01012]